MFGARLNSLFMTLLLIGLGSAGLAFTGLTVANVSLTAIKDNALASYGNETAGLAQLCNKTVGLLNGQPDSAAQGGIDGSENNAASRP